ncbi:site-specific integrase [Enterococcus sp. AZ163]|uniref:site-specific integrase n=1 Tax=Enterococcus sp. AZ163 TaxID=2774638 RepID=UPI003D2AD944
MARTGENIYHRKDLRWEGRFHRGRKADGKIRYGYIYGNSYEEVKEKLGPLRRQAQITLELYGKSVVEYDEWSQTWLAEQQKVVKPATYSSYLSKLKKYIWPHIGKVALYQLDESTIHRMIQAWIQTGLSLSSIKVIFRIVKQSLKYAIQKELVQKNPCEWIQLPKGPKGKVHALTTKEQQRLEKAVLAEKDIRTKAVILAMETGMRIGEIAGLKWEAIDLDKRMIEVNYTYQRVLSVTGTKTALHLGPPKSQSSRRVIPMTSKLHQLLSSLKEESNSEYVFSVKGKPCEPRLLTYHFHRVRKKAKLEDIHFHQLRHTFATRCLESSEDILNVSILLGHTSPQLTTTVYFDSIVQKRIAVIGSMERAQQNIA